MDGTHIQNNKGFSSSQTDTLWTLLAQQSSDAETLAHLETQLNQVEDDRLRAEALAGVGDLQALTEVALDLGMDRASFVQLPGVVTETRGNRGDD